MGQNRTLRDYYRFREFPDHLDTKSYHQIQKDIARGLTDVISSSRHTEKGKPKYISRSNPYTFHFDTEESIKALVQKIKSLLPQIRDLQTNIYGEKPNYRFNLPDESVFKSLNKKSILCDDDGEREIWSNVFDFCRELWLSVGENLEINIKDDANAKAPDLLKNMFTFGDTHKVPDLKSYLLIVHLRNRGSHTSTEVEKRSEWTECMKHANALLGRSWKLDKTDKSGEERGRIWGDLDLRLTQYEAQWLKYLLIQNAITCLEEFKGRLEKHWEEQSKADSGGEVDGNPNA